MRAHSRSGNTGGTLLPTAGYISRGRRGLRSGGLRILQWPDGDAPSLVLLQADPVPPRTLRQPFRCARRARRAAGALEIRAGVARGRQAPLFTPEGFLRFPADRLQKGVAEALLPGALEEGNDPEGWFAAHRLAPRSGRDHFGGKIGFHLPPPEQVRALLPGSEPLAVKAHYALWARFFADTGGDPGKVLGLTLSRLCGDLGYVRLQNGSHRPAHKRQAAVLLDLLTTLELEIDYRAPDGRTCRLTGPLWKRLPTGDDDPHALRLTPGEALGDPVWRAFNHSVGLVPGRLLELRPDRDRWALCLAGYLAPLARMNGYQPLRLRPATLLERTGLLHAERRNPARMREMLERALDRCEAAGIIERWDFAGAAPEEPDMDSPADLSRLAAAAEDWEDRRIVIQWPAGLQAHETRLRTARKRRSRTHPGRGRSA